MRPRQRDRGRPGRGLARRTLAKRSRWRTFAALTLLALAAPAWADQAAPRPLAAALPEVPQLPDEPLPAWTPPKPPPRNSGRAIFLSLPPPMREAQRLRQVGLLVSSVGLLGLFAGGIVYAIDPDNNFSNVSYSANQDPMRNRLLTIGLATMIAGSGVAVVGFSLFAAGQYRIKSWHKRRPNDPLPSMSGL
jgi:hypothetical protein